eukprot:139061_1
MFGWLRKSSKEPTNENKPQPSAHALPQHVQYVHVDDRIQPKSLDQNFENMDDQKDYNNEDGVYTDKPHSVTAARPFFQATQHLDQQQMKQDVIQANYLSDNEQHYDEEVAIPNIPPNNPSDLPLINPINDNNKNINNTSEKPLINPINDNNKNINNTSEKPLINPINDNKNINNNSNINNNDDI